MGHRLSKIYTRTGDDGTTGLGDGARVAKDSLRVEAYGTVDELNSVLGVLLSQKLLSEVSGYLTKIQHTLFELGGELSVPHRVVITEEDIAGLETILDKLNADLSPLKEFILPGGCPAAATCHLARTVCRRAERGVIRLSKTERINENAVKYLNRLSDFLFVVARYLNAQAGQSDMQWQPRKNQK